MSKLHCKVTVTRMKMKCGYRDGEAPNLLLRDKFRVLPINLPQPCYFFL